MKNSTLPGVQKSRTFRRQQAGYTALRYLSLLIAVLFGMQQATAQYTAATCNTLTPIVNPTFSNLTVTSSQVIGDQFSNKARVIDSDLTNTSGFSFIIGGSAWLEVKDNNATSTNVYPAGSFAGFVVSDNTLLSVLGTLTITTYLGGTQQETQSSAGLLSTGLLAGQSKVGFYTTKTFDRIRLSYAALGAGTISVYYAVLQRYCAGPALACNTATYLNNPTYGAHISPDRTGFSGVSVGTMSDLDNITSSSTSDFATVALNVGLLASANVSVVDPTTDYDAGLFAGFEIENAGLLNVGVLSNFVITTYKDGVLQEASNTGGNTLASVGVLSATGRQKIGFITTKQFDEVRLTINQPVSLNLGSTLVYGLIVQKFCAGAALACNTPTKVVEGTFPVIVDAGQSGIGGAACVGCSVSGANNVIDADQTNFATITLTGGVAVSGAIAVKDVVTDYPAGTFVGFDIARPSLLGIGVLDGLSIVTYKDGVQVESINSTSLAAVGSSVLAGNGRRTVGFLASQPFDEAKLVVTQTVGVTLGTTTVYGAVLEKFCVPTTPLACNTLTTVTNPNFPVYVDGAQSGTDGVACVACSLNDSQNAVDTDATNYATMVLAAGVAASGTFAVANALETYPANTFAGFDIESATLLSLGVIGSTATIQLYNNGTLVQTGTGNALIVGASTSLLTGVTRQTVGIVATVPFDEVKISFNQTVGADLGNIKIYGAVFEKTCAGTIACNGTYYLNTPDFPAVINGANTGFTGVACAACTIQDAWNVVSASTTDFARITNTAGGLSQGSISVLNAVDTYPIGTFAGFTIKKNSFLVAADLLPYVTVTTYLDGVQQESKNAGNLLDLSVLVQIFGNNGDFFNVGFAATKPFDEIKLSVGSLVGALASFVDVYGAFVDTRSVVGGVLGCVSNIIKPDFAVSNKNTAVTGDVHTNDAVPAGTTYGQPAAPTSSPAGSTPTLTVNSDGTFTFQSSTPGVYVYDVPVCVPGQAAPCPTSPLTITVIDPAVNTNKPVVNPDAVTIKGAASNPAAVTIDVKANDGPGNNGGTLGTPTITTPATSGTVSIVGGKAVYTPNAGFSGKDTFVYQVCETPGGLCQTATVTVIVLDPGAANTTSATDDYVATNKNAAVSGNVKTNDYDPEGNNQTVNFAVTSVVGKGSLTFGADGSFTFTPAAGFTGPVDFTYTTTDDGTPAASASGTLHLLVRDLVSDFTPNILIDGLNFGPSTVGVPRDFIVNIAEINHVASTGNIKFRIQKLSAFDITYSTSSGNSNVLGGVANSNGDWTFTEDAGYITVETSTGIPAFGNKVVGFKITRKTGIGVNTIQNINVTLFPSTGGESNFPNNIAVTAVTTN